MEVHLIAAKTTTLPAAILSMALHVLSGMALADGGVRTIALSGQRAPGTEEGVVFGTFNFGGRHVELNNRGQVAFYAVLAGPGITPSNNQGAWTEGRGAGLALVARDGDPAPGLPPGARFSGSALTNLQINNAGVTAIGEHNPGFWSDHGSYDLQLIARRRPAPVPGIANALFTDFPEGAVLNDLGRITMKATINDVPALVLHDPIDGYSVLFRAGGQAPWLADGILLDPAPTNTLIGYETDADRFFLVSKVIGPGVDSTNDTGLWVEDDAGALQLVIRKGEQAPGLSDGLTIGTFATLSNDVGQVAFLGRLAGDGINSTNDLGIWIGGGGRETQLAVRLGDRAPGTEDGVVFGPTFSPKPWNFNNLGQISFNSRLTGNGVTAANDSGMWTGSPGAGLELIAREGDPAPGTETGVVFGELDPTSFGPVNQINRLNNRGQMAFFGRLTGPGVTAQNDEGIWAQDRDGVLRLIVRSGDMLDVDDGPGADLRTIKSIGVLDLPGFSDEIQRGLQINDLGQIEFEAIFNDGSSGIFISNLVAVPEPGAWLLLATGVAVALGRRKCVNQTERTL